MPRFIMIEMPEYVTEEDIFQVADEVQRSFQFHHKPLVATVETRHVNEHIPAMFGVVAEGIYDSVTDRITWQ